MDASTPSDLGEEYTPTQRQLEREPPRVSRRLVGFNHATAGLSC